MARGGGGRGRLEFSILGPLAVTRAGDVVDVGSRKQRALLTLLLLHANRVVSVDRLVEELWGGAPPGQATVTLQSYVSNLRRALEPDRAPGAAPSVLVTQAPGYVLVVDDDAIDANRFERLAAAGRDALATGDLDTARQLLDDALALWRGDALADMAFESFAQAEAARLSELRLAATEDRMDVALALGRHDAVVADLDRLVAAHPLRERLRGQLMVALYRSGRQADALRAYRDGRTVLVEELGIDPGPALQQLEEAILLQSPDLDWRAGPAAPSRARAAAPPPVEEEPADEELLLGRDAEISVLERAFLSAASGRGRMVLLAGEPGIGKTHLAETIAGRARARGAEVYWGRCYEGEGAPAFWPWVQLLRSMVDNLPADVVQAALGAGAVDIGQLVPEVKEIVGTADAPPALDPEAARFRLYDAVTRFLCRLAEGRRLVLVIDDLHWADPASCRLLTFVSQALRDAGMLVIGTYRDVDLDPGHPLAAALSDLAREASVERVVLRGLSEADVARYIAQVVDDAAAERLAAGVHRRTQGNPFFTGELVRLLASEGRLEDADVVGVPPGVREVIRRRLSRLPEGAEEVLRIASHAIDDFGLVVIGEMTGLSRTQLTELMEAAVAARLVAEVPEQAGYYRFAHALVRQAVYEAQSATARVQTHARIAELLEHFLGDGAERIPVEMSHHYCAAASLGPEVAAKGVFYARLAAAKSLSQLGYEAAAEQFERALFASRLHGVPTDALVAELSLELGRARRMSGDLAGARAALEEAVIAARRDGDMVRLAQAALAFGGGGFWGWWVEFAAVDPALIGYLEEALAGVDEADSVLRARLLGRLAVELYFAGQADRRRALSEEALAMARRLDDPFAVAAALAARHVAVWVSGNVEERLAIAQELVDVADRAGGRELATIAHHFRMLDLLEAGDVVGADRDFETAQHLAGALRQHAFSVQLAWFRAMRALLAGNVEEAERLGEEALAANLRANRSDARMAYGGHLILVRREQGRLEEAESVIRAGMATQPQVAEALHVCLAFLAAETGRLDEARAELDRFTHERFASLPDDMLGPLLAGLLSETAARLGDRDAAGVLHERLAPLAGRVLVVGTGHYSAGAADQYLGLLAGVLERWDDAVVHLERAVELNRTVGALAHLARTELRLAEVLTRRAGPGDLDRAAELSASAEARAGSLGIALPRPVT